MCYYRTEPAAVKVKIRKGARTRGSNVASAFMYIGVEPVKTAYKYCPSTTDVTATSTEVTALVEETC